MNNKTYSPYKTKKKTGKVVIIALAIVCTILASSLIIMGKALIDEKEKPEPTYEITYDISYAYHTVGVGDSLSYIAEKYIGDYPGSFLEYQGLIKNLNNIDNANRIYTGDVIQVPIYEAILTVSQGMN